MCETPNSFSHKIQAALMLLTEAHDYAEDTGDNAWNFAVEIETLRAAGCTDNDLRWLVAKAYVEPACEKTKECSRDREFSPCFGWSFNNRVCRDRACFIITEAGLAFAHKIIGRYSGDGDREVSAGENQDGRGSQLLPRWDVELRELSVDGQLVKRFNSLAPNQEAILTAFEEDGWPQHIFDPLTVNPQQSQPAKRRLNDAVKGLNRYQKNRLIRFSTDGTGEGVRWQWFDGKFPGKKE